MSALAVTLTVEQLEQLVRGAVRAELGDIGSEAKEILTREEAAELLAVHPTILVKYVRTRGLPAQHLGREWRFSRRDVLDWLRKQPTGTLKSVAK